MRVKKGKGVYYSAKGQVWFVLIATAIIGILMFCFSPHKDPSATTTDQYQTNQMAEEYVRRERANQGTENDRKDFQQWLNQNQRADGTFK